MQCGEGTPPDAICRWLRAQSIRRPPVRQQKTWHAGFSVQGFRVWGFRVDCLRFSVEGLRVQAMIHSLKANTLKLSSLC